MKKTLFIVLALVMLLSLAACAPKSGEDPINAIPPDVAGTPTPSPEPTPEPIYNPLSGEEVDEDISSLRPYAVMINNISVAQPLCGISQAEIIYEVLAEGEITRMMPVFSKMEDIPALGSMRSSRPYYIDIAQSYDAIYVHAGGSEQAYSDIATEGIDNIDGVRGSYGSTVFYRDPSRTRGGYEHSLFTTSENVAGCVAELGYKTAHEPGYEYGMIFTDEVKMGDSATVASTVDVSFDGLKHTKFTYHPAEGYYTGYQFSADLIDGNTNEVVQFENLVVLYAETKIIDNDGRRTVNLYGTGTGHFINGGLQRSILWSHSGDNKPFLYSYEDGTELEFGRGKTYIAIVPMGSTITMQ